MVEVYVKLVLAGRRKLDEVPDKLRVEVASKLNELKNDGEDNPIEA